MPDAHIQPSAEPRQIRDRTAFVLIIIATFGLQSLTVVTGVISARVLGVEGRGVLALVFALGLFASQLTFGGSVPVAIAKNLAERRVVARDGLRAIVRRRAVLLVIPCLAAGAFLLFLQRAESGGEKYLLAATVFVMAMQTIVFRILSGCLQGERHLVRMAWAGVLPQFLFTVLLATAWFADWNWTPFDMLMSYFASCFIGLAFAYFSLAAPSNRPEDALDEDELWLESRKSYVSSVRPLDSLGLDRIMVGALLGTVSLGLYAAASAVSNLCTMVSSAVTVIVLPRVAMYHDAPELQWAVIRRWVGLSAAIIVVMVLALEAIVGPAIRLAFGEEFVGATACARWLILADGIMAFRKVLIAVMQGQGRGGIASWIELGLLPVLLVGIVIAAQNNSLSAIGISLVAVAVVSCLAMGRAIIGGRHQPAA